MAQIRRRGPLQWHVRIRRKGFPEVNRTLETEKEAKAFASVVESEMVRGAFVDRAEAERTTLGEVLERYLKEVTPTKKGAAAEDIRIRAFIKNDSIAKMRMSALSSKDIAKWRDKRLAVDGVSGSTVNREMNILSHAIQVARREWSIGLPENPVHLVARPKSNASRDRRLTAQEEKRLIEAITPPPSDLKQRYRFGAHNPWLRPIVELALETAMRRGELLALRWSDIDLKAAVAVLRTSKTGDGRGVPLSRKAIATIRALPRPNCDDTESSKNDDQVFPVTSKAVEQAFARALERAEVNDFRFHDLRHEATSRLFEKGLNVMEVAAITGHKELSMLKRYTHLRAGDLATKLG